MKRKYKCSRMTLILTMMLIISAIVSQAQIEAKAAEKITVYIDSNIIEEKGGTRIHLKNKRSKASYIFSSDKKSVASVSKKGIVTGKNAGTAKVTVKQKYKGKIGSISFLMGLAQNGLGYHRPAAILDRSKNKCCGLITDGEELKNNQLCFSVDTTVLHLFSDLSRTCPRTSGGWVPPLALSPKNNRSVSFLVA